MLKAEKEMYFADWDDCTDMTEAEFLDYVKKQKHDNH